MPTTDESGLRRTANYWVPETETSAGEPQPPDNPNFRLWSRTVQNESGESSGEYEESLGLGDSVATDKHHTVESHERTIMYEMCRFPEDAAGNPQDPAAYAARRDIDNQVINTLSHLKVVQRASLVPDNTIHHKYFNELDGGTNVHPGVNPGPASRRSRTETYCRGGLPDEPEITANPGDSAVITNEMGMMFAEVREYQIDQPAEGGDWIHVRSTDGGDTSVAVELESADGVSSETVTTNATDATTAVATTGQFDTVRVSVPGEFNGTIELYDDDGSGVTSTTNAPGAPAQLLTYIRGANTYDNVTNDHGVPLIGTGSFETANSLPKAISAVKSAGRWDGSPAAQQIMGSTITLSNNPEDLAPAGTFAADIKAGQLEVETESTVYGETEGVDYFKDHIEGREGELRIPTTRGDFIMPRAYVAEGGETEQEAGEAVMQVDVVFRALAPADGSDPLQFAHVDAV